MWRFVIWYIKPRLFTVPIFFFSVLPKRKMKKMVVMMEVHDDRSKDRVLRTVASCSGLTTITMDSKDGKLTVIGDFDAMKILTKLKRRWNSAKMATFGTYDAKKEAETAAAAEKKKKEESERPEIPIWPPTHHHTVVCDHDHYHGCVIS